MRLIEQIQASHAPPPAEVFFESLVQRILGGTFVCPLSPDLNPRLIDATPTSTMFRPRCDSAPTQGGLSNCAPIAIDEKTAIDAHVAREFVLPEHMKAIESACRKGNFIASFRLAGEATLHALALGAPAKWHDILEKTIKKDSIKKNYPPAQVDAVFKAVKEAGLWGYVGHWDKESGALRGIYMGSAHRLGDKVRDRIYPIDMQVSDDGNGVFSVDMDRLNASLAPLKSQENWESLPFTGDYDMHDLIYLAGRRASVPSCSGDERRLIGKLNAAIANIDPLRHGKPAEYNLVRHGPQVSYIAFARERKEPIVPEVAKPSFPIAFVHQGRWTIIENTAEHNAFYRKIKTNMKSTWTESRNI